MTAEDLQREISKLDRNLEGKTVTITVTRNPPFSHEEARRILTNVLKDLAVRARERGEAVTVGGLSSSASDEEIAAAVERILA